MRKRELLPTGWDLYQLLLAEADNDLGKLIFLADQESEIRERCLDSTLNPIWEEAWSNMNAQPTFLESQADPTLQYRPLKPQPHCPPFYRLAGIFLFHRGRAGHRELLVKAAQAPYYSFHALRALAEEYLKMVNKGQPTGAFALLNARKASSIHHAPGFILLAETYFDLGVYFNNKNSFAALEYFTEAYKNIVIADELQPYCADSMHNAYYGLGPEISNGFGLKSTQEIMRHLQDFLVRNAVDVDFSGAKEQGLAAAKEIVDEFYGPSNATELLLKKARVSLEGDESELKFTI